MKRSKPNMNPESGRSFNRIRAAEEKGAVALTLRLCEDHVRKFPAHAVGWVYLGQCLVELHDYKAAKRAYAKAKRLCPPDKAAYVLIQLGFLADAQGNFRVGERWHLKAAQLSPDNADFWTFAGVSAVRAGALNTAELHLRRALECSQGCLDEAWFNLGGVMLGQRRFEEARDCYRKALGLDPKYRLAKERLRDVEEALRRFPN